MDIHFISTLTPEDEGRFAPMVLAAVKAILDPMPISYAIRIATADGRVFNHTKAEPLDDAPHGASAPASVVSGLRRASLA